MQDGGEELAVGTRAYHGVQYRQGPEVSVYLHTVFQKKIQVLT